ncbi:hypothetical protein PSGE105469_00320 [Pseudomonas gessardii]
MAPKSRFILISRCFCRQGQASEQTVRANLADLKACEFGF